MASAGSLLTNSPNAYVDASSCDSVLQLPVSSCGEMPAHRESTQSATDIMAAQSVQSVDLPSLSSSTLQPESSAAVTGTAVSPQSETLRHSTGRAMLLSNDETEVGDSSPQACHVETMLTMHSPDSVMSTCEASATTSGISSATPGSTPTSDVSLVLPQSEPCLSSTDVPAASALTDSSCTMSAASTLLQVDKSSNYSDNHQSETVEHDSSTDSTLNATSCSDDQATTAKEHEMDHVMTGDTASLSAAQMSSENSDPDPAAQTLSKDWRCSVTQDLRNHLVNKL